MSRVVIILTLCAMAAALPIIRIKNANGQKKSYCCYGVVQPFDLTAKAKQGLRALHQVGFDLNKLRKVVEIYQKAVEGKLKNVEKEAEDLTYRVQAALKATMKILSDATKKASKTLSEVTEASNDLGQLGKDIQETKTHDMITKIRELIAEKPESSKKSIDKKKLKKSDARSKDSKSMDKKADHHHKTLKIKKLSAETTEKDHANRGNTSHKSLSAKDRIPLAPFVGEKEAAERLLENAEKFENEKVKRTRDAIEKKTQENERAVKKAREFLQQVETGLLQIQNGIKGAGIKDN